MYQLFSTIFYDIDFLNNKIFIFDYHWSWFFIGGWEESDPVTTQKYQLFLKECYNHNHPTHNWYETQHKQPKINPLDELKCKENECTQRA